MIAKKIASNSGNIIGKAEVSTRDPLLHLVPACPPRLPLLT